MKEYSRIFVIVWILACTHGASFAQKREDFPNASGDRWTYRVMDYRHHKEDQMEVLVLGSAQNPFRSEALMIWQYRVANFTDTQYVGVTRDTLRFYDKSFGILKIEKFPLVVNETHDFSREAPDSATVLAMDSLKTEILVNDRVIRDPLVFHSRLVYVVPNMGPFKNEIITDEYFLPGVGMVRQEQRAVSGSQEYNISRWDLISSHLNQ